MAIKLKVSILGLDVPISFPEAAILLYGNGLPHPLYKVTEALGTRLVTSYPE